MQQETEPMITYSGQLWQGENNTIHVSMSDATFQRYVKGYLEVQGIPKPTPEQQIAAVRHVRRVSYWQGVQDSEVRVIAVRGTPHTL